MNLKNLCIVSLFLIPGFNFAQEKLKYTPSGSAIQVGVLYHNIGSFGAAIEQYKTVSEGDTNYLMAQYELSLSYNSDGKYTESLDVIASAMDLGKTPYDQRFINNKGVALREMGQLSEAVNVYTEGLKRFPYSTMLYYGRGLVYEKQKAYQAAFDDYKQAVKISPFYAFAHYKMGTLLEKAERPIEGLLCLTQAATINSYTQLSQLSLDLAENIAIGKKPETTISLETGAPEETIQLLEAKLKEELSSDKKKLINEKIDNKLLQKITQLLSSVKVDKENKNFWYTYYFNFFGRIIPEGHFEAYSNYVMANYSDPKISNKAKKENTESFKTWGKKELDLLLIQEMEWNGKKQAVRHWLNNENGLSAIGNINDKQDKRIGYWEFYFNNGQLNAYGLYNQNGEREGVWVWKDNLGNKIEEGNYIDGKADGEYLLFHSNGNLKRKMNYHLDTLDGVYQAYSQFGTLVETTHFKKGKKEGLTKLYFEHGPLQYEIPYTDDEINGTVKKYYISGEIDETIEMKDDQRNGIFQSFYLDSTLHSEGVYKDDLENGKFVYFFKNGQKSAERTYKEGNQVGVYRNYYSEKKGL